VTFGPPAVERKSTSEPGLAGAEIGDYGIAYKAEGVNLWDKPGSSQNSKVVGRLPFNTRMYIHSQTDRHYFVGTDDGRLGYAAVSHVKTGLPEPDAKIYHIQSGDTALGISRRYYGGKAEWGADHRFFVNGLVHVNRGPGMRGIEKPDPMADWDTTVVRAGYMIWVPSLAFMRSLRGVVGSGSITYEAWQTVKRAVVAVGEFLLGTGAFVVGILHGALESVWDVLVGFKDLLVLAYDLIKWLIGLITGDSKGLFDSLKDINWGELIQGWIDDFLKKWNHDSILKRWHFRGWVIGYILAEVLMLFFSGGVIQGIKWIGKSAKVAKVVAQIPKVAKLCEAAKRSKVGQAFSKVLSKVESPTKQSSSLPDWLEPTAHSPTGPVKTRRPHGFDTGRAGPGRNVKPGTAEGLERAYDPTSRSRKKGPTREQQLEGIGSKKEVQIARDEFNKVRAVYAAKLGVKKGEDIHHAIELVVLEDYPGVFTSKELNSFQNMRGIPAELEGRKQLHNSKIRELWDKAYRQLDEDIIKRGLREGTPEYKQYVRRSLEHTRDYVDWVIQNLRVYWP
jgi:hypothetical protein